MTALQIATLTLACLFGCAALGIFLHPLLPEMHRGKDTLKTVKLGIGMVITVTSLVLSLLIYSTKSNFDATETNVRAFAASIILLDRSLRAYGPDGNEAREVLSRYSDAALRNTWPEEFGQPELDAPVESLELGGMLFRLHDMIRRFQPDDGYRREIAAECRTNIAEVERRRFFLTEQVRRTIPPLLLTGVIAWLAIIFLSFGLNAPRNPVVLLTMALCALAIASCIYLVDEMDRPITGIIKISSQSMREALTHLRE